MKKLLLASVVAGVVLMVGGPSNLPPASAQRLPPGSAQRDLDLQRQLYNSNHFQELSGAARTLLERKFGKKEVVQPSPAQPSPAMPVTPIEEDSNILVNSLAEDHTAADTQSETTLVVFGNAGIGAKACSGYNDSGSNVFAPNNKFTGFSQSTNGGASWTDKGVLPTNGNGDAGDPVLARSSLTGTIFLSTLQFSGAGVAVFRSTDGCSTFGAPVQGAPGKTGFQDKEWIAVDNFAGSGQGNVYLVERDFGPGNGIYFYRSLNDGVTFSPSGGTLIVSGAANNVQGAYVAVGPDHSVYVFYFDQTSPQRIRMVRSFDHGLTFGLPITVATLNTTLTNGNLGLGGGFRTNAFPQAVVNPVEPGSIYVVFNDKGAGTDKADIFFTQSNNFGAAWSTPVRVNGDSGTHDQWQPTLAVMPNGQNLFISFYDRRLDPANSLIDVFGAIAHISNGGIKFQPNFRITDTSFPVVVNQDPLINPTYMGDYDQSVADQNFFYVTWGDNRLPNPNFPAHTHQPDVRFAKFLVLAGVPGQPNCHGLSVSALAQQFGGLDAAAQGLGFPNVQALQDAISTFCGRRVP